MKTNSGVNGSAIVESSCAVQEDIYAQEEEPPSRTKNLLESIILDIKVNPTPTRSKSLRITTSNADFPVSENSQKFIKKYYPDVS
ncbi:MAG: hypothetical protein RQ982_02860, partial [Gammaproteobacteria bacterium]|nr:hypothetical protein [Gammaproteobacteria bacterium]